MKIYPFKALKPRTDLIKSADSFFGTVKLNFPEYKKRGFYEKIEQEAFYIYRIKNLNRIRTGVLVATDISDLKSGKIAKHEKTLDSKEQKMMHLLLERGAMIKPVLLSYPAQKDIEILLEKNIDKKNLVLNVFIAEDKSNHEIYMVKDQKMIDKISKTFKKIDKCYIADGHHRCTTSQILSEREFPKKKNEDYYRILSAYFAFKELDIFDYNRVVQALEIISLPKLMVSLSEFCQIKSLDEAAKPDTKHTFSMFVNNEWFLLTWKKKSIEEFKKSGEEITDTFIFNEIVLKRILKIENVRFDKRVKYVGGTAGIEGVVKAVNKSDLKVGFCLYPINVEELINIVDHNKTLPPKSTWFEPRMKNGMIVQEF